MSDLSPEKIAEKDPGSFRSAIVHYGGLRNAFKELNIEYPFEEIHDWKIKVLSFLGMLPDTQIANAANVSVSKIRSLRKKHGISRFTISKVFEEEVV